MVNREKICNIEDEWESPAEAIEKELNKKGLIRYFMENEVIDIIVDGERFTITKNKENRDDLIMATGMGIKLFPSDKWDDPRVPIVLKFLRLLDNGLKKKITYCREYFDWEVPKCLIFDTDKNTEYKGKL